MKTSHKKLSDFPNLLENGDLLLFHGEGLISETILEIEKLACHNDICSHVAIYTQPQYYPKYHQHLSNHPHLTLESTASFFSSDTPDLLSNKLKFGVQMRDLSDVISQYLREDAYISIGKIKKPIINQENSLKLHEAFLSKFEDLPYEYNLINLAAGAVSSLRPVRNYLNSFWYGEKATQMPTLPFYDLSKPMPSILIKNAVDSLEAPADMNAVFCSELAMLYHKLFKMIPKEINPANNAPVEYITKNLIDELIYLDTN